MNGREWFESKLGQFKDTPAFLADDIITRITAKIYEAMERNGITQQGLADRMGVTPSFVSQTLNGRPNMTIMTLCKFASALDLRPKMIWSDEAISDQHKWGKPSDAVASANSQSTGAQNAISLAA